MWSVSWNNHNDATASPNLSSRASGIHTFNNQIEWNMNLAGQEAINCKDISQRIMKFRGTNIRHVADKNRYTSHVLDTGRQRFTTTKVSGSATIYNDEGLNTLSRFEDQPRCYQRLYTGWDWTRLCQSTPSRNQTKSEIFWTSTWVHAISIVYRPTDIQHVVDTHRNTYTRNTMSIVYRGTDIQHVVDTHRNTYTRNTSQSWFTTTNVYKRWHTHTVPKYACCQQMLSKEGWLDSTCRSNHETERKAIHLKKAPERIFSGITCNV